MFCLPGLVFNKIVTPNVLPIQLVVLLSTSTSADFIPLVEREVYTRDTLNLTSASIWDVETHLTLVSGWRREVSVLT